MNIFVLDQSPEAAARALSDGHVPKMVLETAQIMCTVAQANGYSAPYKPTHERHACTVWAGASRGNWEWLDDYAFYLCCEYIKRFGKPHSSERVFADLRDDVRIWRALSPEKQTPFAQAMPEQYRGPDAVEAYRRYYAAEKVWQKRKDGRRIRLARWERGTPAPAWWPHREAA